MIVTCDACSTRYRIDEHALEKQVSRARCCRCDSVFTIRNPILGSRPPETVIQPEVRPGLNKPVVIDGMDMSETRPACKVITVCNQKGGVAKTTTCLNLATSLVLMKKRVLVIDFDIQANLSLLLNYRDARSFFDVTVDPESNLADFIVKTGLYFWLLPSNSKMTLLSKQQSTENFQYMLRDMLVPIKPHFDYILIDTPPSGDFFTLNALLASDMAAICTQAEFLSMNGINHIQNMINLIREKADHHIDYHILVTMFDRSNTASKVIYTKMNRAFTGSLFQTIIEKDDNVPQSQIVLSPTMYYNKSSRAGLQYFSLAKEILAL